METLSTDKYKNIRKLEQELNKWKNIAQDLQEQIANQA